MEMQPLGTTNFVHAHVPCLNISIMLFGYKMSLMICAFLASSQKKSAFLLYYLIIMFGSALALTELFVISCCKRIHVPMLQYIMVMQPLCTITCGRFLLNLEPDFSCVCQWSNSSCENCSKQVNSLTVPTPKEKKSGHGSVIMEGSWYWLCKA